MKENTRLLVLAGVHGEKDGRLGDFEDKQEDGFVADCNKQIALLKKTKYNDIVKKSITFLVHDVGEDENRKELDCEKFTIAVKEFQPTVIILAFCWSKESELNDILRAAGIYTAMILREEMAQITENRHIILDEGQEDLIRTIVEKKPQNIFLWGSSGTGKTQMPMEALLIKISQCRREGRRLNVMVASFLAVSEAPLMEDFRKKYLPLLVEMPNVRFVTWGDLCTEFGVERSSWEPQLEQPSQ